MVEAELDVQMDVRNRHDSGLPKRVLVRMPKHIQKRVSIGLSFLEAAHDDSRQVHHGILNSCAARP